MFLVSRKRFTASGKPPAITYLYNGSIIDIWARQEQPFFKSRHGKIGAYAFLPTPRSDGGNQIRSFMRQKTRLNAFRMHTPTWDDIN